MKGTIHGSGLITENFPPRLFVIELKSSKSHLQWVYYSLSDLGALNYQVLIQKLIYWSERFRSERGLCQNLMIRERQGFLLVIVCTFLPSLSLFHILMKGLPIA